MTKPIEVWVRMCGDQPAELSWQRPSCLFGNTAVRYVEAGSPDDVSSICGDVWAIVDRNGKVACAMSEGDTFLDTTGSSGFRKVRFVPAGSPEDVRAMRERAEAAERLAVWAWGVRCDWPFGDKRCDECASRDRCAAVEAMRARHNGWGNG